MRYAFFFLLLLFGTLLFGNEPLINDLRTRYFDASHDVSLAPELYEDFKSIDSPSPLTIAYQAATEAMMCRTTWNIFKKAEYLKLSRASFQRAVAADPNNIEIRFLRFAIEYHVPSYLGFSEHVDEDKQFIIDNLQDFNLDAFGERVTTYVYDIIIKSNRLNEAEIKQLNQKFALVAG